MELKKQRNRQLREIRQVLNRARFVGGKPGDGLALVCAIAVFVLIECLRSLLLRMDIADISWWVTVGMATFTYFGIRQRFPHKTYAGLICDWLAIYQPVNGAAYRELQEKTVASGLRWESVDHWWQVEWNAVQPQETPPKLKLFLERRLGPRLVKK